MDKGPLIRNAIKENLRCGIKAHIENRIHFVLLLQIFNSIWSHHLLLFYLAWAPFAMKNSFFCQGFYEGDKQHLPMKQGVSAFSSVKQSSSQSSFRKKCQPEQKTPPDLTAQPSCSSCKASAWIRTIPALTPWTSLKQNSCAEHLIHKFLANHE